MTALRPTAQLTPAPLAPSQLSPNFSLAEMTVSQLAVRRGFANVPSAAQVANLRRLCVTALEPLRMAIGGVPLVVSSGYRNASLNLLIGGAINSDHMDGRAADVTAPGYMGGSVLALAGAFLTRANTTLPGVAPIEFDQLIFEGSWLHITIPRAGARGRREVLTATFRPQKPTVYKQGLPT